MDAGFTLIVKYGERGLATKCSGDFSRKELVPLLMAKWNGINKDDVFLSYELLGVGGTRFGRWGWYCHNVSSQGVALLEDVDSNHQVMVIVFMMLCMVCDGLCCHWLEFYVKWCMCLKGYWTLEIFICFIFRPSIYVGRLSVLVVAVTGWGEWLIMWCSDVG